MLKHKRLVSIIATVAFCLSFLAPAIIAPAPALAADNISAVRVPVVSADSIDALGTVRVEVPADAIEAGDKVIFTLPEDCEFITTVAEDVYNRLYIPTDIGETANGLSDANLVVDFENENEVRIEATADQRVGYEGVFYLYLGKIDIGDVEDGDLIANFDGPVSGFPHGDVVVARTSDKSSLKVSASGTETANDDFEFTLRIREDVVGALKKGNDSLILTLPDGYEWTTAKGATTLINAWGANLDVVFAVDEDEFAINVPAASTTVSAWDVKLNFEVVDESAVEPGDIMAKVKGKSNISPNELKVGKFGDFGVTLECDEPTEVFAGQLKQEIGTFVIEENIPASLVAGRSITLTLPSYAKWTEENTPSGLTFAGISGSDGNVLKYTINKTSGSATEFEFEDFEVALDVTAPGDLVVEIGGNAGVKGEVVVAKIALPVTMTAENATEVKIGAAAQKIADFTITEMVAGGINDDTSKGMDWFVLKVPAGCEWATIPTITVESGDLKLDLDQVAKVKHPTGAATSDYYQFIKIPVQRDSNEPSVIKVTDCYVTVDRTVPEGNMIVALLGTAVLQTNGPLSAAPFMGNPYLDGKYVVKEAGMFPQTAAIAGVAGAKIVTPSQGSGVVSFYIGSQVYTVNGVQKFMDVAPFIKADRTYVPVRFLSEALGADVAWDEATKTVTVTKGDKTVVLVIGSTIAKVNGADVQMDVAPEISGVGRTMLPARWVAEGLGYQVGWIPTVKQVVIQ